MRETSPRIVRTPTPGVTPEHARDARARAWIFVFESYAKKKAAGAPNTNGDDGTKIEGDSADGRSIP